MPRSLGRASLVLLGSTWTHGALSLLMSVLVARVLGAPAVGTLALNLGLVGLAMAALLPGFAQAHLKRLAEGQDAGRCLGTMLLIQGVLSAALLAGIVVAWSAGALDRASDHPGVFLALLGTQLCGRLGDVFLRVLLARQWIVAHGAILLGARLARLVATAIVLMAAPTVAAVAATFLLESALMLAAAPAVLAAAGIRPRAPTRDSLADYWRYARPFLVTTPLALVQDSMDRVLVARWAGLTAAGYYHVARGVWEVLAGAMGPPVLMLFTRLSALYAERSPERDRKAQEVFFSGLDKMLFVATAMALAFWTLAGQAITLVYGSSFTPVRTPLRILVATALAAAVVNPYTFVLQARDEVERFVGINVARFVVYMAALAVLVAGVVPGVSGEAGAALARLLLMLFPAWVWMRWTREVAGIPFYGRATVYLAGFALAVSAFHLTEALVGSSLVGDILAAGVAFVLYANWLLRTHPHTRANLAYTVALVVPPSMTSSARWLAWLSPKPTNRST
jgi:O-antigen/teichoic acid export membrane protein